jgi:hypothetical protein
MRRIYGSITNVLESIDLIGKCLKNLYYLKNAKRFRRQSMVYGPSSHSHSHPHVILFFILAPKKPQNQPGGLTVSTHRLRPLIPDLLPWTLAQGHAAAPPISLNCPSRPLSRPPTMAAPPSQGPSSFPSRRPSYTTPRP